MYYKESIQNSIKSNNVLFYKNTTKLIVTYVLAIIVSACSNNDLYENIKKDKTIIIYMVADNNLHEIANDFVTSISNVSFDNSNLIVYIDDQNNSRLYEMNNGPNLLKEFSEDNSLSPKTINSVLKLINTLYPSVEKGLIFWSHGTGWLNDNYDNSRSFGLDKGHSISISELTSSLPTHYNYIIFDACYMSSIEILFELKDKTDYLLASPTIVPNEGIINQDNIDLLFSLKPLEKRLSELSETYKDKYLANDNLVSIALTTTSYIDSLFLDIHSIPPINIDNVDINNIPVYDFKNQKIFFDAAASFEILGISSNNLKKTIKYSYFNKFEDKDYCGVSLFIPYNNNQIYYNSYTKTKWNQSTLWLSKFY